ncbi:BCCT family transporter [Priestia aryabhattai]|uniref:BCCT family transporter n=1 Tax=Priestia aryabhattai TaxID=412384 RepID=UPI0039A037FE
MKLTWGLIQSLTAIILLWTDCLDALQTAAIIAALPFSIVLVLTVFSLMKAFKEEGALKKEKKSV